MPQREQSQLERLQDAIAALPEPARSAYRLHLFDGLDYLEIAAMLRLSTSDVERHIATSIVMIDRALRRASAAERR